MHYMMMIKNDESKASAGPPEELMNAVGAHIEKYQKLGKLVGFGGLLPSAAGAKVIAKAGKLTVVDGPFAEAKELIGGYAIMQADSKQEAIELAREFMSLHTSILGASYEGECEIREMEALG